MYTRICQTRVPRVGTLEPVEDSSKYSKTPVITTQLSLNYEGEARAWGIVLKVSQSDDYQVKHAVQKILKSLIRPVPKRQLKVMECTARLENRVAI